MTTYKEIKGTQIEVLSSDPSNPVEGQVWYNSTSNVLKGQAATGTDNTVALAFGGDTPPNTGKTEDWNGNNWTEIADLSTARKQLGGTGTTNATTLAFGGATPTITTATEEFSSSSNVTKTVSTD